MVKKNKQLRLSLNIITILFCTLSLGIILHFTGPKEDTVIFSFNKKESSFVPVHLKIPKINVDAYVDHVGLASDGTMDVPAGPASVAWFALGPHPGENGSSVINGHSGWKNGVPAVFDNLYKLQKGDKIYVEDGKGAAIAFIVREIRTYDAKGDAGEVFGLNDGTSHLNLITCAGVWNETDKTHSERLVVFTDKVIK